MDSLVFNGLCRLRMVAAGREARPQGFPEWPAASGVRSKKRRAPSCIGIVMPVWARSFDRRAASTPPRSAAAGVEVLEHRLDRDLRDVAVRDQQRRGRDCRTASSLPRVGACRNGRAAPARAGPRRCARPARRRVRPAATAWCRSASCSCCHGAEATSITASSSPAASLASASAGPPYSMGSSPAGSIPACASNRRAVWREPDCGLPSATRRPARSAICSMSESARTTMWTGSGKRLATARRWLIGTGLGKHALPRHRRRGDVALHDADACLLRLDQERVRHAALGRDDPDTGRRPAGRASRR